jgi:flavorubredoxin
MVGRKIQELLGLSLPINVICPSHGIIWRDNPMRFVEQYQKWAANYQENQITVVYDTMWNSTRKMAEAIAAGISAEDPDVTIKIMNAAKDDKNDIITEIFRSKTVVSVRPRSQQDSALHRRPARDGPSPKFKGKSGAAFAATAGGRVSWIISKSLENQDLPC